MGIVEGSAHLEFHEDDSSVRTAWCGPRSRPEITWKQVVTAAKLGARHAQDLGLSSWVKTTGGPWGLHVGFVPI